MESIKPSTGPPMKWWSQSCLSPLTPPPWAVGSLPFPFNPVPPTAVPFPSSLFPSGTQDPPNGVARLSWHGPSLHHSELQHMPGSVPALGGSRGLQCSPRSRHLCRPCQSSSRSSRLLSSEPFLPVSTTINPAALNTGASLEAGRQMGNNGETEGVCADRICGWGLPGQSVTSSSYTGR